MKRHDSPKENNISIRSPKELFNGASKIHRPKIDKFLDIIWIDLSIVYLSIYLHVLKQLIHALPYKLFITRV